MELTSTHCVKLPQGFVCCFWFTDPVYPAVQLMTRVAPVSFQVVETGNSNVFDVDFPDPSETVAVKKDEPRAVGVPEMAPEALPPIPFGSPLNVQLNAPVRPNAANVFV